MWQLIVPVLALLSSTQQPGAEAPNHISPNTRARSVEEVSSEVKELHGRRVLVEGFATIKFEDDNLCPAKVRTRRAECLWIGLDDGPIPTQEDADRFWEKHDSWQTTISGRWVLLSGIVDAEKTGHLGGSFAELRKVEIVSVLPDEPE